MIIKNICLLLTFVSFVSSFARGEELNKNSNSYLIEEDYYNSARYHFFETKCYRKAMYYAMTGANLGSSDCMLLLRKAYGSGLGVVQDTVECVKWLFLASALGNEEARAEVKKLECLHIKLIPVDYKAVQSSMITWEEARKNAKKWMDEHPELFFSLN